MQKSLIAVSIRESIEIKQKLLDSVIESLETASHWILETLESGHKLLLCGNGGSAADAQHIAAEFVGRFERERRAWPAIALTTDTSILTALGNDYGMEVIFARQVEALGQSGDLLIALSTSGNSPNVIAAIEAAHSKGLRVIGLTGEDGGAMASRCDLALQVPSSRTARIQECHIMICHTLCEVVEIELSEYPR